MVISLDSKIRLLLEKHFFSHFDNLVPGKSLIVEKYPARLVSNACQLEALLHEGQLVAA